MNVILVGLEIESRCSEKTLDNLYAIVDRESDSSVPKDNNGTITIVKPQFIVAAVYIVRLLPSPV